MLKESLEKDRISFHTSCGIHKDDIIFKMNDYSVKKIGSQGQQKSFLISLKLAQFDFLLPKKLDLNLFFFWMIFLIN